MCQKFFIPKKNCVFPSFFHSFRQKSSFFTSKTAHFVEFVQKKQKKPQTHQSGKNIEENIENAPNFPISKKMHFLRRFFLTFRKNIAFFLP